VHGTDLSCDVIQPVDHARGRQSLEAELGAPTGQRLYESRNIVADETEACHMRILSWGVWVGECVGE
jgi:hypothetical protein